MENIIETYGLSFSYGWRRTAYHAATIPRFRFLLIDAEGKFVSAQMPMPSENTFEMILRNTIGLED